MPSDSQRETAMRAARTRRQFLQAAGSGVAGLSLAPLLASCGGSDGGSGQVNVTEFVWVGSNQDVTPKEVNARYLKSHPDVEIELVQGTNAETFPKILTSIEVTPDEPLVNFGFFNADAINKGIIADAWVPLTPDRIPNITKVLPEYRVPDDQGVYFASSPIGLMYNTKVFKERRWPAPTSWKDLWDPRFKGKVAFWDAPSWSFNGVIPTARLYGGGERNIEPAMKVYERAARGGQIHSLYTSNDQGKQLLVSENAWLTPFFFGIMQPWAQEEGAPLGYAVPEEGQVAFQLGFGMVKGSSDEQQRVAADIINRMLDPRVVKRWADLTYGIPLVKGTKPKPSLAKLEAYDEAAVKKSMQLDWTTIAKSNSRWSEEWNRRVKANLR